MGIRTTHDLFRALEHNEIVPWYQPQVELRTGRLNGFEVLARWVHPDDGIIPPTEFIPLAEEHGCIGDLTNCLLRQVFVTARSLPESLSLSVNISPLQFRDPHLAHKIEAEARAGGFALDRLKLEVTESALVGNAQQAYLIAMDLKALGIRLSLDDFGTGYSSLRHLQSLPFDELKVDASFVRSMGLSRESRKIAAAVVGLGQSLGLTTVAEGVEKRNQAEMLLWLGCDVGQGWLFGRPVPEAALAHTLGSELFPHEESDHEQAEFGPVAPWQHLPANQRLAQLEAIYDGVPVGLCYLDRSLRFLSVNRCFAEFSQRSVGEYLGRSVEDVFPGASTRFGSHIRRALAGESPGQIQIDGSHLHADGRKRHYLLMLEPARDEAGEVIGVSVALIDTPARADEPSVERVMAPLEHRVLTGSGQPVAVASS